jgi:rubrerythrin
MKGTFYVYECLLCGLAFLFKRKERKLCPLCGYPCAQVAQLPLEF